MHERLIQWMGFVIPLIEAVAIAIVLWGSVEGLAKLLRRIALRLRGQVSKLDLEDIRIAIGEKMVLGLEFFLVGDIIQTIIVPSWQSLAMLAGIVGIRTVIVYFLNKEVKK